MQVELKTVVGSSMIAADGYNAETQTLAVKFANSDVYEYRGVDSKTYEAYDTAESKGKYFSRVIKPNIQGVKV